jgi:hypothetical protein
MFLYHDWPKKMKWHDNLSLILIMQIDQIIFVLFTEKDKKIYKGRLIMTMTCIWILVKYNGSCLELVPKYFPEALTECQ